MAVEAQWLKFYLLALQPSTDAAPSSFGDHGVTFPDEAMRGRALAATACSRLCTQANGAAQAWSVTPIRPVTQPVGGCSVTVVTVPPLAANEGRVNRGRPEQRSNQLMQAKTHVWILDLQGFEI